MGLFRKGKIGIIAKFHRTDLVIWSHSRGTKTLFYSRINTVCPECLVIQHNSSSKADIRFVLIGQKNFLAHHDGEGASGELSCTWTGLVLNLFVNAV